MNQDAEGLFSKTMWLIIAVAAAISAIYTLQVYFTKKKEATLLGLWKYGTITGNAVFAELEENN